MYTNRQTNGWRTGGLDAFRPKLYRACYGGAGVLEKNV